MNRFASFAIVGLIAFARGDETALDFEQVKEWAAPRAADLVHREVAWLPAVVDGVIAGEAQDKPLLLWLYFGGPLGDC